MIEITEVFVKIDSMTRLTLICSAVAKQKEAINFLVAGKRNLLVQDIPQVRKLDFRVMKVVLWALKRILLKIENVASTRFSLDFPRLIYSHYRFIA